MDVDREDTDHDEYENEGQGEDLQLVNDRSECVYTQARHSSRRPSHTAALFLAFR
jgi:hypothetical protein